MCQIYRPRFIMRRFYFIVPLRCLKPRFFCLNSQFFRLWSEEYSLDLSAGLGWYVFGRLCVSIGQLRRIVGSFSIFACFTAGALAFGQQNQPQIQGTNEYVEGEIIVKLKSKGKSLQSQAFVGKAVSEKSMTLKGSWGGLNIHHFSVQKGANLKAAIDELKNDPEVEYAEPNFIVRRQSVEDESFGAPIPYEDVVAQAEGSEVGSMSSSSQTTAPIQLLQAWSAMTSGKTPPVVAVIDTGVDLNHSVFVNSGAIWTNSGEIPGNGIDDDKNGYVDDVRGWNFVSRTNSPQDDDGHGTHVAGIILGTTQDIFASPIAAASIRIMALKFLDANGSGTTSDAVNAIYYAVNNGAKVLNNSWGGGGFSNSLLDAISYAYSKKAVFVAAAGNSANNNDAVPTYPANYSVPNIMSIAATSDLDGFASFSNYGVTTVGVGSPGVSILSTYPGSTTYRMSGTSMATPFVTGIAALMVREAPTMTGYQIKNLLYSASNPVSSLNTKTSTKARINVYNSIASAKGTTVDSSQPAYDSAASRAPSSESSVGPTLGGCGLIANEIFNGKGGDGGSAANKNLAFFALLSVLFAPVLLSLILRQRSGANKRRFTRYQIDSQVRVRFGDRELVGQVSTISLGGVQLNADAWLENGGIVKMAIQSPDGKDMLEVDGKVVWSEEKKHYGVEFENANQGVVAAISRWTQSLLKA